MKLYHVWLQLDEEIFSFEMWSDATNQKDLIEDALACWGIRTDAENVGVNIVNDKHIIKRGRP